MIRIDSHNHFWQFDPVRDTWIDDSMRVIQRDFLPESLLPVLNDYHMDGSIAVHADQSEEETKFLLKLAGENEFILGVVGWIDLCSPEIEEKLSIFRQPKLCGFRHIVQAEPDEQFLVREDFISGLRCLKAYDLTYDILIYPNQLPAAIELVNILPDQKFVLDHIAKPLIRKGQLEPWASQIRELGSSKNVYCKVSGIITEADHQNWNADEIKPYIDVVFESFGTDKLMFGSDWPVCLLAGSYSQVIGLIEDYVKHFDEKERDKIFGGNAFSFYNLSSDN